MSDLPKTARELASGVLRDSGGLELLHIHEFADDEAAHDDERTAKLYEYFKASLDLAAADLSREYGPPSRIGSEDHWLIKLNGVFRYAMWQVEEQVLFIVAAHEDRGPPILLMVGSEVGDVA